VDVALIGVAGSLLGNAILTLSRLGYREAKKRRLRGWAMFAFWVTTASIGNFIDYVPIRTFTGGWETWDRWRRGSAGRLGSCWSCLGSRRWRRHGISS
jgi:hypothetical protein